jgi:hypothetical protein
VKGFSRSITVQLKVGSRFGTFVGFNPYVTFRLDMSQRLAIEQDAVAA